MRNETNSDYINIIISQFIRIITVLVMMLIFEQLKFFTKTDVLCIGVIAIVYIGISTVVKLILKISCRNLRNFSFGVKVTGY